MELNNLQKYGYHNQSALYFKFDLGVKIDNYPFQSFVNNEYIPYFGFEEITYTLTISTTATQSNQVMISHTL